MYFECDFNPQKLPHLSLSCCKEICSCNFVANLANIELLNRNYLLSNCPACFSRIWANILLKPHSTRRQNKRVLKEPALSMPQQLFCNMLPWKYVSPSCYIPK